MAATEEAEDDLHCDSKLNKWNASVQQGDQRRQQERQHKTKWLGDGSKMMAKSLKQLCKKMQHNHRDDDE